MESRLPLLLAALVFSAILLISSQTFAQNKPPSARMVDSFVSTDWLEKKLGEKNLVILDIRSPDDFGAGHIVGSINEPFVTGFNPSTGPTSKWIVGGAGGLWLEVP